MKKYVYYFGGGTADGDGKMKDVLGGKGAGLAEMCRAGIPVPPGFTISTEVCVIYFENGNKVPDEINDQVLKALAKLEKEIGKKLGDPKNPLLVSVRSGAKFSMPGMMNSPATRASPTIPTGALFRCSAKWRRTSIWSISTISSTPASTRRR
jgi:pyruvate,orthophosphate dikinase